MAIIYSEEEIELLLQEQKFLPTDWRKRIALKSKRGHDEQHLDFTGNAEGKFRIIFRKSHINSLDFSIILATRIPQSNQFFRLLRYNGKSHEHTNHIEGVTFYDFHIHFATERYQRIGSREDGYTEQTDRYSDLYGALNCLIKDANIEVPPEPQSTLF
ncbi:MAG: hypothetical protein OXC97_05020 [Candidatus Dadabacteria bacterium]|nr:hypothetical protein [Candidatus Dadabacteria bacterium]